DFEKEYRTHKFWPQPAGEEDRTIVVSKDSFKEIIFGALMNENEQNEIIEICKAQEINVSFYKTFFDASNGTVLMHLLQTA
ncbi:MAG TPA: hypothetical protein VLB84_07250, partial [Bacteroidia bacterium]|nr:hypothetical protein [Bacteroidia bacterium]